ncbi:hypothetical protein Zmor_001229 [Zophobas morio]|uniref:Uncharacterized protein n=1 Tax=Zophobas morio TaxID=2755281 RepID=A0AA38MP47_9CUCU|nr:hypothetical protein Zmor_001229 [Zophobas morio]
MGRSDSFGITTRGCLIRENQPALLAEAGRRGGGGSLFFYYYHYYYYYGGTRSAADARCASVGGRNGGIRLEGTRFRCYAGRRHVSDASAHKTKKVSRYGPYTEWLRTVVHRKLNQFGDNNLKNRYLPLT